MTIDVHRVLALDVAVFRDVLRASGFAERRPVDEAERLHRMLANSNLIVVAQDALTRQIVGVSRSVTDFAYCCYVSDLAVRSEYQGGGIGSRLLQTTREIAGPEAMCLLLSSPGATGFYEALGMTRSEVAYLFPRQR